MKAPLSKIAKRLINKYGLLEIGKTYILDGKKYKVKRLKSM